MPTNIEIKARTGDLLTARRLARSIGARPSARLAQVDTYFRVPHGRLKLRELRQGQERRAELIWYRRPDRAAARESEYRVIPVSNPDQLKHALAGALGVMQVVRKRRELWMYRNVRIHLDRVEKLGNFVELEAVVGRGRANGPAISRRRVARLIRALEIDSRALLAHSYSDMIG